MSEIIDTYELELSENINQATTRISNPFQTKQDWKEFRSLLTECQKGIKLIQTQLVSIKPTVRAGRTSKLRKYKKQLDLLKRQAFTKENNWQIQLGKRQLLGDRPVSVQSMKTYEKGTQATQRLRQSVKVMYQNLEISQNVGNQLSGQTTKLINSKKKVEDIRHDLKKSERKIKSMMMRIKKNKFVLRGIIGFIILVFIVVIVSYFR